MEIKHTIQDLHDEFISGFAQLPESVQRELMDRMIYKAMGTIDEIKNCQSPIEQIMFIALDEVLERAISSQVNDLLILIQEPIVCGEEKYRVDLLVVINYRNTTFKFVIECDGHEFHEKTKEQVRKDRKRERDLMAYGNTVIRFSGSEIVADNMSCAREAMKIIKNIIHGES